MVLRIIVVWLLAAAVLVSVTLAGEAVVREVVGLRNANTRVWEVTRQVPVTDDATGLTEMVTVKNQVYEKADNLCYNRSETATPDWVPTVEEITPSKVSGIAYEANQGAYQVSFVGDLTAPWSIIYKVKDQTFRLGIKYLGYYDSSNGSSVFLATPNAVVPQLVSSNKLVYRNVFPGVDIEYVYTKGAFLQNAIINSVSSYQSPSHYGFNPASTQLIVATELDLGEEAALKLDINNQRYTGTALNAGDYPITVSNSSTSNLLCNFAPNQAFDNQENKQKITVQQRIMAVNGKHYLVEGIPLSWLSSATLPVTIDYDLKSGGLSVNETWLSGKTYYISSPVTVNSGYILAIQGGAIVKIAGGQDESNLNGIMVASGGKIVARGSKFNYIVFTSADDDSIGETISGGYGGYNTAIKLQNGSSGASYIRYCKITNMWSGLFIDTAINSGNQIQNNIIRYCTRGILCGEHSSGTVEIKNNLIVHEPESSGEAGIVISRSTAAPALTVELHQNTIDGFSGPAISLQGEYCTLHYYDNIISNCVRDISADPLGTGSSYTSDHNAYYNVSTVYSHDGGGSQYFSTNPYVSSPNGSYYLYWEPDQLWGASCINNGSMSAATAGMDGKTVFPPSICSTNFTSGDYRWSRMTCDTGTVDIGYHYEPVDVVIQPASSNLVKYTDSATLTIDPGVVVSFYRTTGSHESKLRVSEGGKLTAVGSDTAFIEFTSLYATSDLIQAPLRGGLDAYDYSAGIIVHAGADSDSDIEYCDVKYANTGIRELESLNLNRPIQNNYFSQNCYGIAFDSSANHVVNNLFAQNKYGVTMRLNELGSQNPAPTIISYLQSNTFYGNDTALYLTNSLSTATSSNTIIRLENNIFSSNYAGAVSTTLSSSIITIETRNNCFWNNQVNVIGSNLSLNTSTTENRDIINESCPMLVHKARLSANQRVETTYPHDGFYLGQRDGDASRFPLQVKDVVDMHIFGMDLGECGIINVYATNASNTVGTFLGCMMDKNEGNFYDGDAAPEPQNLLIQIVVVNNDYLEIEAGASITLMFDLSTVKVYLPYMFLGYAGYSRTISFWVAIDGSIYYAASSRFNHFIDEQTPEIDVNQDAWFAMQYDMPSITGKDAGDTGLAMSAYDGRYAQYGNQAQAQSPAVDKGAVKVTPHGIAGTTNDVNYTLFASLGWTNTNDSDTTTRDCQTTARYIPSVISTNHTDPIGRLDLGYHYNGNVVYTQDLFNAFTTYNGTTAVTYSFAKNNENHHIYDLGAGDWDVTQLTQDAVVVFRCQSESGSYPPPENYTREALGFHVLNTPIVRIVNPDTIFIPGYLEGGGQEGLKGVSVTATPSGKLYTAMAYTQRQPYNETPEWYINRVQVYEFNTTDWTWWKAGEYYQNDGTSRFYITDVAIAASNDTVWVVWAEDTVLTYDYRWLRGKAMSYSETSSINTPDDILQLNMSPGYNWLDLTYDAREGTARITFIDDRLPSQNPDGNREIRCSHLIMDQGKLSIEYKDDGGKLASDTSWGDVESPKITPNPYCIYSGASSAFISYHRYYGGTNGYDRIKSSDLVNPSNETWSPDSIYTEVLGNVPDVTYRFTGEKVVTWLDEDDIMVNGYSILRGNDVSNQCITINSQLQRDYALGWQDAYDVNNDQNNENVICIKELLP